MSAAVPPSDDNPFAPPRTLEPAYRPAEEYDDPEQAELAAFVGRKAKYYLPRWSGAGGAGFNWAGFFLGPFWMAYRKMYWAVGGYAVIILALVLGEMVLLNIVLGEEMPAAVDRIINLGLAIGCGSLANKLYLKHARRQIARAREEEPELTARLDLLSRRGGTSWLSAIAALLLFIVVMGGLGAVIGAFISPPAEPEYEFLIE